MSWQAKKSLNKKGYMRTTPVKNYKGDTLTVKEILEDYGFYDIPSRGISKETCEYFGVKGEVSEEDGKTLTALFFPSYDQNDKIVGYKKKDLTVDKEDDFHFTAIGRVSVSNQMFGQPQAQNNLRSKGNSPLVITEGELDCMAYFEACKQDVKGSPRFAHLNPFVTSINMGTAAATDNVISNLSFVSQFADSKVIFAFDNDSATPAQKRKGVKKGVEATEEVCAAVMSDFIPYVYKIPHLEAAGIKTKDLNDMLLLHKTDYSWVKGVIFNCKKYNGEKIISLADLSLDAILAPVPDGVMLPQYPKLMSMLGGFRGGELNLIIAPPGVGKSSFVGDIETAVLLQTEDTVATIRLEEVEVETAQRVFANILKVNYNKFKENPLGYATREEMQGILDNYGHRVFTLDHFGAIATDVLMEKVKTLHYVHKAKCITLDHISLAISGDNGGMGDTKLLDNLMGQLASFTANTGVIFNVIAHMNRDAIAKATKTHKGQDFDPYFLEIGLGAGRGSSSLEGCAWNVFCLEPEILPSGSRGRTRIRVPKNRSKSKIGIADLFYRHEDTGEVVLAEDSGLLGGGRVDIGRNCLEGNPQEPY